MAEQTLRAFVAIDLPEAVRDGAWDVQEALLAHRAAAEVRWVEWDAMHLTIKFLGDIAADRVPALTEALEGVAARWHPFALRLGPLGAFPNVHAPHTLWLAAEAEQRALVRLHREIERALQPLGFRAEQRGYHPHLTLGRVPRRWTTAQRRAVGDLVGRVPLPDVPSFTVASMVLIESELTRQGPVYTRLATVPFGEPPPFVQEDERDELP